LGSDGAKPAERFFGGMSGKETYALAQERKAHVVRSSQDRRAEIVEAAFLCLQEYGYAKLTARKIAEHSNISLGHITYHFKDMKEVLVETYRYASLTLFEATQRDLGRSSKSPIEQLRVFLGTGFSKAFLKRDYLRVRIDLWSAALAYDEIATVERELYESYRSQLSELLRNVAVDRQIGQDAVAPLADIIMATLDGLWLDWERRHDEAANKMASMAALLW
jgi:TetR/AcrR family transcriptional repressor of bet genes